MANVQNAEKPSSLNIVAETEVMRVHAVSPASADARWMRVLIVSIGALVKGPTAPEIRPAMAVWYDGSCSSSGWYVCRSVLSCE